MVICQCQRVTERDVERVLASGARTPSQVTRATRAGTLCGGCLPEIQAMCRRAAENSCDVCVTESLVG